MELKLVVVSGRQAGTEIPIPGPMYLIGRGEDCQLRPQSNLVSRRHCAIILEEGRVLLQEFGSTNGTYVNGERVKDERELKNGDRLKIGVIELEVQLAVSLAGKKKSKVHNVQEAAARTVASAAKDDDLDITGWLKDEEEEEPSAAGKRAMAPTASHDTSAGGNLSDTTAVPAVAPADQTRKEQPSKIVGQFRRDIAPPTGSSESAAKDMLKQFAPRKK